jgi:hypothetical protein
MTTAMRYLPLLSAAAGVLLALPADAAQIRSYKVGNWDIGVYTNDSTGRFSHCAAAANYKSGITLLFSVSENLEWAIGFSSPDWNLRPNREIDVEYRIDNYPMNTVTGRSVNNKLVRATLPDSVSVFNQFRYGLRLVASVDGNRPVNYNLTSTAVMLTEILNCAKQNKGAVDTPRRNEDRNDRNDRNDRPQRGPSETERDTGRGSFNDDRGTDNRTRTARGPNRDVERDTDRRPAPERDADRQPAPDRERNLDLRTAALSPETAPTSQSRSEANEIVTNILRRANIADFQVQRTEQLSDNFRAKYDSVWKADGVTGTLRVLADNRASTVDRIRADVIASDAAACKGKFASGALPAMQGSQSITIYTSCEG